MELIHLKYFQNVARTEHITKSSKELNIVQPALSRSIHTLEKELGVDLFDRNGRTIKLNKNGKSFLKTVDEALSILESGKNKLLDMNNKLDLEIKLLVFAGSSTISKLVVDFRFLYPDTTFKLLQHNVHALNYHTFDFCISSTLEELKNPYSITLIEEEMFIGVSTNNPLSKKDSIYLKEASNENFISFEATKPFRKISDKLCLSAGFTPNTVFESDVPEIIRNLIREGFGISFIPQITWNIASDESIKLLHVIDPPCKRYLNISWHPDNYMSSRAKIFKDFVVDYYSKL